MVEYKIIIKKRFSIFKTVLRVCANTNSIMEVEKMIQEKLKETYFSIVTAEEGRIFMTSTYDIESMEVLPQ